MKIKEITSQSRRDFYAIYQCEHCGFEVKESGYDDDNFHRNVVPNMVCSECGKIAPANHEIRATKYPDNMVI